MYQKNEFPVIAIRETVLFPGVSLPLLIGRTKSLEALKSAKDCNSPVFVTLQLTDNDEYPSLNELSSVGIVASVLYTIQLPDESIKIFARGEYRAQAFSFVDQEHFISSKIEPLNVDIGDDIEDLRAMCIVVSELFDNICKIRKAPQERLEIQINSSSVATELIEAIYIITHRGCTDFKTQQSILENYSLDSMVSELQSALQKELHSLELQSHIQKNMRLQIEKSVSSYKLGEKFKHFDDSSSEFDDRIKESEMPESVKTKLLGECEKYKNMNPASPESSLSANYISYILELPWNKHSSSHVSIPKAEKILNEGHYGMEKAKERIIEYMSVLQKVKKVHGSIICLVGAPGVGKTSFVKSIAKALSRGFAQASLGGVHDVAEIRGHRKTYIGAMPGKIIQGITKAGIIDPVFLLDEIDKMGSDIRGDPASALLEVLDPEHNHSFTDHYLEIEFDLSNVVFIATANSTNIPYALLDRMEIINLSGYADNEKIEIAKSHLIPKRMKDHKFKKSKWSISDEAVLSIISSYTMESGVRELDRNITKIMRKSVRNSFPPKNCDTTHIKNETDLTEYLGAKKYLQDTSELESKIGVATGLAYTSYGGTILKLEAVFIPGGKGEVVTTGKLGEVMQESVKTAHSLILSGLSKSKIKFDDIKDFNIHIHFPEGAVPKDGPSAGIAIYTVINSLIHSVPVNKLVAMTGEITLRGDILPIGGLKEKLLAAIRAGITTVLIPKKNEHEFEDISEYIKSKLKIIFVAHAHEVLDLALIKSIQVTPDENKKKQQPSL